MGDMVKAVQSAQKYAGQDCTTILQDLTQSMKKITDREVKRQREEAGKVQKDFEARKSGGLWDDITSGPLSEFKAVLSQVQTNYNEGSQQQQGFLEQYQKYLDMGMNMAGMATNLVSGVTNGVVDELDVINAVGGAAGMGSLVPTGENEVCGTGSLLIGTVTSVIRVGSTAATNAAQSVFAVQSSIGMALQVMPDLYSALMSMPSGLLSIILTNKEALLDRIESTVKQSLGIVVSMTDKDYPFDHAAFIAAAKARLEDADADLSAVEETLEAGGLFQEPNWKRAKDTIKETGNDLLGVGVGSLIPGFVQTKIIQILGYQKLLETLIKVLDERQGVFARLAGNIGSFQSNFQATAKFQNLMTPIVQQVRCTLKKIIQDMGDTININALIRYFIKEKKWGIDLLSLAVYMANTGHLGDDLGAPSSTLNSLANKMSASIGDGADYFTGAESYDVLTGLLANYTRELKMKASRNTDSKVLEGIAQAIYIEIGIQRKSNSDLSEILNGFNSSIAGAGLSAIQAVSGLLSLLGDQGLDTIVESIMNGDIASLFSANAVKRQVESTARKAIGDALQCCADNAGDGDAADRLTNMSRVVQDLQKGKEIFDRYTKGYADLYVKNVYKRQIPGLQQISRDVASVKRARCMNKGQAAETGDVGLTLV